MTCKLIDFGVHTTLAVTFFILVETAIDRYIHIDHPFRARTITWKHSRNVILLSWICGVLFSSPFLKSTVWAVEVNEETMKEFGDCDDKHGLSFQISLIEFLLGSFLLPLVFMAVVYSRIVIVLWQDNTQKHGQEQTSRHQNDGVGCVAYFITWNACG